MHMLNWLDSCSEERETEKKTHTQSKFGLVSSCQKYPLLSISFVFPLPFFTFLREELRDGTASPLRGLVLHHSIFNGCQMCVRGGHSVSVFHVSSQHDEQGSSWR